MGRLILVVILLAGCGVTHVYRLGADESVVIHERPGFFSSQSSQIINANSKGEIKRVWMK